MFIQLERHFVFISLEGEAVRVGRHWRQRKNLQQKGEVGSFQKRPEYGISILGQRSAQALSNQRFPPQPAERAENSGWYSGYIFCTRRD